MDDDSINLAIDEEARRRFESAWQASPPAHIEDFLPAPDSDVFLATLEELVQIELEFFWKSGKSAASVPPLVESYLLRFPQLDYPDIARRLLRQEHLVRHRYGDRPSSAEYAARFPLLFGQERDLSALDEAAREMDTQDAAPVANIPASAGLPDLPGYDVLKILGRGATHIVLQARQHGLNRLVAIKIPLHGSLSKSESDRLQREALSVAKLVHPNICPIYEVAEHRRRPYIAMAYIDGQTLQTWAREKNPTARQCSEMVARIARAIAYAHDHGFIHRDIKPAKVLIERASGEPILAGFTPATEIAADQTPLTSNGTALRRGADMSREQATARPVQIGPASDVYSLGAMLYELLCGQPPFMRKAPTDAVVPLRKRAPGIHRDLETICMKALAQEPSLRYSNARELAEDLERFSRGETVLGRREGIVRKAMRRLRQALRVRLNPSR